jgi:hypothetical protein
MNLTETGMSTSALAPAAQDEIATLFVGFELSKATWLIGLYSPQLGKTISRYKVDGGDVDAALKRITVARLRLEKLGTPVRVVSIYEAGYDGFWLHRRLTAAASRTVSSMPQAFRWNGVRDGVRPTASISSF